MTARWRPPNLLYQIGNTPDTILYPIFMDARLLIVWHSACIYQACVLAPGRPTTAADRSRPQADRPGRGPAEGCALFKVGRKILYRALAA
jgi:hypothetical protein